MARVKLIGKGVEELLNSAGTRAALEAPAEAAANRMRANAPVESGTLAASIHIEDDTTDRAVKRVVADVDYAMIVEANTGFASRSLG